MRRGLPNENEEGLDCIPMHDGVVPRVINQQLLPVLVEVSFLCNIQCII